MKVVIEHGRHERYEEPKGQYADYPADDEVEEAGVDSHAPGSESTSVEGKTGR